MADLTTDVRYIKGIGEKKALALNKLGVFSLFDLISYFPRKYEDRSVFKEISEIADGESVCVRVIVADSPRLVRIKRGLDFVRFHAVDDTGSVEITYFNQSYIKDNISRGDTLLLYGKMSVTGSRRSMSNPSFEKEGAEKGVTGQILPIYKACSGLTQRNLTAAVRQGLDACGSQVPDILPPSVRDRCRLAQAGYAYENIHFPSDYTALELARRRFIFEELFILACAMKKMHSDRVVEAGLPVQQADIEDFWAAMPFSPTGAQRKAVRQSIEDLHSDKAMNRLVQGDVGSGKTLVAAALIWYVFMSGYVSAFMAPTEILAEQHYATLSSMLYPFGLRVGLLTGSMSAKEKRQVKASIKAGEYDLIIGTHALFSADVEYTRLGLVVTDEQHRFGVAQRATLIGKGEKPHVLVMSATPIPRTLALIIYGDLDVSIIDELPPGRQKVDTFCVDSSYRRRLNGFITKLTDEGRQVFVVCPKVEDDDDSEDTEPKLKSAQEHAKELQLTFPNLSVGCVHGKMKPKDKDAAMAAFVRGETNILVATTVIEVGVDVPNSALIIIENAERFGLSQLHQLRGRVGRGKHKSYCVLVTDNDNDEVKARMNIMCKSSDGFKISEEDLRMRGPGDFFGSRQHGLPAMHVADLGADMNVMQQAQEEALLLLNRDPDLTEPENLPLRDRIAHLFEVNSDSFN